MITQSNGELVPVGGGDTIPLVRNKLVLGRRESCDVCLRFPNISGQHCELLFQEGVWFLRDLGSTNGTKVNGERVQGSKALRPGDQIEIAKRRFTVQYKLAPGHKAIQDLVEEDISSMSLLEKAGLANQKRPGGARKVDPGLGWGG